MKVILNNPRQFILSIATKDINFHKLTDKTYFEFRIYKNILIVQQLEDKPNQERPGSLYQTGSMNKGRLRVIIPSAIIDKAKLNVGTELHQVDHNGFLKLTYEIPKTKTKVA